MKKIALTIFLLMFMMSTHVFAATGASANTAADVTMEIVEDNICTIDLDENASFEKKIIDSDLKNHEITLQLKVTNNSEVIIPEGELMLVIDSSLSMDDIVEGTTTRKNSVLNSANKLVESLLKANPSSLDIGVVTFSTGAEKNDEGFLITGTANDAQKVCDLTNDFSILTDKISAIEGTGQYTNLDAGLQLAQKQFSTNATNKYIIVLTDGLPNLAVGYNDLVSYDGLTDVINQTKSTITSLKDINIITMLTGIDNEEAILRTDGTNTYTYGQVITEVFGTQENPTVGKFYKIDDTNIEKTITYNIYRDLLPIEKTLDNITILDYFPKEISDNFEIVLLDNTNASIMTDSDGNKYISWKIEKLSPNETKSLKYTLSLKDKFDETILDKILDTNAKVDITYKDLDGEDNSKTSDVTPKIELISPEPEPIPEPEPPQDTAPEPLPKAGSPIVTTAFIVLLGVTIFFAYKSRDIK